MTYLARLQFVIHSLDFRNCLAILENVDLWILKDRQELTIIISNQLTHSTSIFLFAP